VRARNLGTATGNTPFKILRAATNANGADFVGGAGFTALHPSTGHYHVNFHVGAWNNAGRRPMMNFTSANC
jgi:hypothetical protein